MASGLDFQHVTGGTGEFYFPEIAGAGVALIDYDGDGDLDVYLLQGNVLEPAKRLGDALFPPTEGYPPGNRLFRNESIPGGELTFVDVTAIARVGDEGYGMGTAVGDFDNDGNADLYVTNFGANVLYRNNGDETFSDVIAWAGVDDPRWSTSAAFLDYDGDGDLDLLVVNYVGFTLNGNKECFIVTGGRDYCGPQTYHAVPDRLFRNEGEGKFSDATGEAGIGAAFGPGLGVSTADFNGDGWPDIYVANDGAANQLWINRGDGRFEDVALMAGAAYNDKGAAEAGMGVSAGDFDADGDMDLFLTHLIEETNTLYRNDGGGLFSRRDQRRRASE